MKSFIFAVSALLGSSLVSAQSLPPSPTASTGCEPHGDHWHCDAPVSATPTPTLSATPTATESHDHDHDHDHDEGEDEELPPSPTASVGCEPHGDHWHCDGPAETGGASQTPTPPEGAAVHFALPTAAIVGGIVAAVGMGL